VARATFEESSGPVLAIAAALQRQKSFGVTQQDTRSVARLNGRKRIVILGGGCGGVVAATHLGRKLGANHDVILVDRRPNHVFMPAFLFLMLGQRQPQDISRSLGRLRKRNVNVVQSEILGIDPSRQEVVLQNEKISYDYLIVSLGLQTRPDLVPGLSEASLHPWEMETALRLRDALAAFRGGRIVIGVPLGPYRCPPAPYEAQWMLDGYFRQRGLRERVDIEYFTRDSEPTGEAHDPLVWMDAESKNRNIKQNYEFVVRSINPEKKLLHVLYNYTLSYD
jgi:sulfide:quinone oxidoreductase